MSFVFQDHNIVSNVGLHRPFKTVIKSIFKPDHYKVFPQNSILVWLTYWRDAQNHGPNAAAWQRTNLLIHSINALLLVPISGLAALLFFVHPLTLMGSSYVTGRSGSFGFTFTMLAILAFLHGWLLGAFLVAAIAAKWLKQDLIIVFALLIGLWYTR